MSVHECLDFTSPANPLLPRAKAGIVIGQWNQDIYLLGGSAFNRQVVTFKSEGNNFTFTSIGDNALFIGTGLSPSSQQYTQVNNLLFANNDGALTQIQMFDLSTTDFWLSSTTIDTQSVISNLNTGDACYAANDDYLFVIGGRLNAGSSINNVIRMELSGVSQAIYIWEEVPSMIEDRTDASCIIDLQNRLYAIGGQSLSGPPPFPPASSSIERIQIQSNMTQLSWTKIGDLTVGLGGTRSLIIDGLIYVFGGYTDKFPGNALDIIHIIDPVAATVTLLNETLPYAAYGIGMINFNGLIYGFGGQTGFTPFNAWFYQNSTSLDRFCIIFIRCHVYIPKTNNKSKYIQSLRNWHI